MNENRLDIERRLRTQNKAQRLDKEKKLKTEKKKIITLCENESSSCQPDETTHNKNKTKFSCFEILVQMNTDGPLLHLDFEETNQSQQSPKNRSHIQPQLLQQSQAIRPLQLSSLPLPSSSSVASSPSSLPKAFIEATTAVTHHIGNEPSGVATASSTVKQTTAPLLPKPILKPLSGAVGRADADGDGGASENLIDVDRHSLISLASSSSEEDILNFVGKNSAGGTSSTVNCPVSGEKHSNCQTPVEDIHQSLDSSGEIVDVSLDCGIMDSLESQPLLGGPNNGSHEFFHNNFPGEFRPFDAHVAHSNPLELHSSFAATHLLSS